MCISNFVIKLKPEEIPEFMRGKFYELHKEVIVHIDEDYSCRDFEYAGWVHIREDGTIEFGEPGA